MILRPGARSFCTRTPKDFVPWPFAYRQELSCEVSALTSKGLGVCRVAVEPDVSGGGENLSRRTWVVMVPWVLPGELVRVGVFRNHSSWSEADLLAVEAPSPHRVVPPCPHFGACGGCQYQHIDLAEQRRLKSLQVADTLERIGGPAVFDTVKEALGHTGDGTVAVPVARGESGDGYGYRTKLTPHHNGNRASGAGDGAGTNDAAVAIGFNRARSPLPGSGGRGLVDVPRCEIAHDAINAALPEVREREHARMQASADSATSSGKRNRGRRRRGKGSTLLLRAHMPSGGDAAAMAVCTKHSEVVTQVLRLRAIRAKSCSVDAEADATQLLHLRHRAGDFFQNNSAATEMLVDFVREHAMVHATDDALLVDCYSGSGMFALACAPYFPQVIGVEVAASAVEMARDNAVLNSVSNARFVAADATALFAELPLETGPMTAILDPPRAGCDEQFLVQLLDLQPRRVIYISCDPATQARDAQRLVQAGYSIVAVQPFDMFPQTRHIESVIVFDCPATKGESDF